MTTDLPTLGPSPLQAVIRLQLAVHCQSATGAGRRRLDHDSVTSNLLQHLPGLVPPSRDSDQPGLRHPAGQTVSPWPDQRNTDPGAPAWPTHSACGANPRRQLDQVGLGLDWPPSAPSAVLGRSRTRGRGANHASTLLPTGPTRTGLTPGDFSVIPVQTPTPPSVQGRPASATSPPGQDLPRAARKGSYAKVRMY